MGVAVDSDRLSAVALSEAAMLNVRPEPRVVERLVVVRESVPARMRGNAADRRGWRRLVPPGGNLGPQSRGTTFPLRSVRSRTGPRDELCPSAS